MSNEHHQDAAEARCGVSLGSPSTNRQQRAREMGTAGEHTHGLLLAGRFNDQAEDNVRAWGIQRPAVVYLAMMEELMEIGQEMQKHTELGDGGPKANRAQGLIQETIDLGNEIRDFLEENYEPGDPPDFDIHGDPVRPEPILDEIEDAGPLMLQMYWSVEKFMVEDDDE